jgi:chromosome segregation ATPase
MSTLSKILEKAGLIEREASDEPVDVSPPPRVVIEDRGPPPAEPAPLYARTSAPAFDPTPAPAADAAVPVDGSDDDYVVPEGISTDAIYQQAAVPASAYSVERLAKLIDGLKQLDPATQRAAVLAMDAADDTWAIEDIVEDARKKIDALRTYSEHTSAKLQQIQAKVRDQIQRLNGDKDKAVNDIQAQIADLQKLLESTGAKHAAEIAKLNSQATSAQQAADRERVRVSDQAKKMAALVQPFVTTSNQ